MNRFLALLFLALLAAGCSGAPSKVGAATVARSTIAAYLDELGLNTPGVADNVTFALNNGDKFREKVEDKTGHATMLTAWVERGARSTICMTYYRDEKCPDCNGTGARAAPGIVADKAHIAFNCRRCKGEGILRNQFHRRCWVLSSEEFRDRASARVETDHAALQNAPAGTAEAAARLGSDDPRERLEACQWLDRNYVRPGQSFQELTPVLERAQYVGTLDSNHKLTTKIIGHRLGSQGETVYQFLAGRGWNGQSGNDYYRIVIDNHSGKVVRTYFVADAPRRR